MVLDDMSYVFSPSPLSDPSFDSIFDIVKRYDFVRRECDNAISRLEYLLQRLRCSSKGSVVEPSAACGDLLRQGIVRDARISNMIWMNLPEQLKDPLLCEVRDIRMELSVLQVVLKDLEDRVLHCNPKTSLEAVSQMNFLSMVLMDGGSFDHHELGQVLSGCMEMIQSSFPELRAV